MSNKYADLRKAVQRRNIFCQPDVLSEYRAAADHVTIRALLADYDNFARILDGLPQDAIDGGWTAKGISAHAKALETENQRLRNACEKAIEWLEGWASAEPYLSCLRAALAKEQS